MAFENLKSTGIKYVLSKLKEYFLQIKDAVKSVNGIEPDETGDITIASVPYAQNLESESSHRNAETFILRTAGGASSVENGDAWLMVLRGNNEHTGYVAESIELTVTGDEITATIDRDTFVEAVTESGTITLTFTTAWSADPATYGITVTGTPENGNTIVVEYTAETRGTIKVTEPEKFISTGWNLFNYADGYARTPKYEFGYRIDGTYTALKYSATEDGTKSDIAVNDHMFDIPADGFVWVTGGNSSDTAIYPVWEDWTEGYTGSFEAYDATEIDIATAIASVFPYGLLKAGNTADELDLNLGQAISRVERLAYTAENRATAKNSGREYEFDENYIYLARATAQTSEITIDGLFTTNDHGVEYFTELDVPIHAEILYGNNLKNKLERDVLTISSQSLTDAQQAQVQSNLSLVPTQATDKTDPGFVADARIIKTLADQISSSGTSKDTKGYVTLDANRSFTLAVPSASFNMILLASDGGSRLYAGLLFKAGSTSSASVIDIHKGDNVSRTVSGGNVTFTFNSAANVAVRSLNVKGDGLTLP